MRRNTLLLGEEKEEGNATATGPEESGSGRHLGGSPEGMVTEAAESEE